MRRLTARDVMNPEVLTVRADMRVRELATFLLDNEISGAPVEDAAGKLVGVVSLTDVALAASEGEQMSAEKGEDKPAFFARGWQDSLAPEEIRGFHVVDDEIEVREIMTPAVFAVGEDAPVGKVASTMLEHHIHRLVVTRGEQLVGIITTSDLLGILVEA